MAHGKETPRQKMIGMMYLVLTALLALNISREVLEAFVLVDDGLSKTTEKFNGKNEILYNEFDKSALSNPHKVKPWQDKAMLVRKEANELYDYIQKLKIQIITKADNGPEAIEKDKVVPAKIASKDNTDIPAEVMVGDNNDREGKVLKNKIIKFRELLLSMVDSKDQGLITALNTTLNTNPPESVEGETRSWESEHFEHLPLIAVTTLMSKMQSDVRNAEADIVQYLYNQIEASSFKFNKLDATIIPNSNYILRGNEYQAEVFMAAFDTTQSPKILIGNVKEIKGADGKIDYVIDGRPDSLPIDPKSRKGIMRRIGSSVGKFNWGGIIQLKATDGSIIKRPFKVEYQVAEATTVISATKMNVFYIGVDNPVDISVPGVPADKVFPSINNGVIRKVGNSYIVNPTKSGKATVAVEAEIDKKRRRMGDMEFRVMTIPDPIIKVNNQKGGRIDKNTLLAQMIVKADLENFVFDAKFNVIEFTVNANVGGFKREEPSKGPRITDAQREIIRSLKRGEKIYFDDVKAVGPDGKTRELGTLKLIIQ